MATAYQPAKVVRAVCRDKRDDPVAILVTDPEAPTHRFHQVKDVVASAGSSIDWNKTLDREAAVAVYRLWAATAIS